MNASIKICGKFYGANVDSQPSQVECVIAATVKSEEIMNNRYFSTIRLLMLAGF